MRHIIASSIIVILLLSCKEQMPVRSLNADEYEQLVIFSYTSVFSIIEGQFASPTAENLDVTKEVIRIFVEKLDTQKVMQIKQQENTKLAIAVTDCNQQIQKLLELMTGMQESSNLTATQSAHTFMNREIKRCTGDIVKLIKTKRLAK